MIKLIAAIGKNLELGAKNSLLWHIPEDMKYFREVTRGSTVIMGRKTYESIGRPLPKRRNLVITRSGGFHPDGVEIFPDLDSAIKAASGDAFIIGGGSVYAQAVDLADEIYLTEIDREYPEADVFFPDFDHDKYLRESVGKGEEDGLKYEFAVYKKHPL